ncbi:MAG TPA: HdeD family acid-resistance protein [Mycobacterium sp.]|nr:HdeD family acid-resistance protein [Mycobacterium sp.]
MHRIWSSAVVSGLLAVVLGAVILAWPGPSILVTSGVFGAYLVVSGVAMVVLGFSMPVASGASRFLSVISGVASVVLGILAFKHFGEGYAVLLLAIWIGVGFIVRGVTVLATAIADKQFPGRGWAIFFGIVSVLAGFVVLAYPFDSIVTLALVAGIWLVVLGVVEVISGIGMRSDVKKVQKVTGAGPQPHAVAQ